ncbi:MAG TPA: ECF transporter S component [Candidatus Onthocola gallistercoris]|uniref:ECF transporter S component n=1 Tax=Candidatus Onthocola gallistercoris TaxID=2840876 RepID=A0A9D1HED8_9FIRM|nr:ECF transporter S component [Candidatus Onthocola gallistercoris]
MEKTASKTKLMVLTALFAAMTCVATLSLHIPTPGTGGYIHPGDALVVLSGILLGPIYGGLAAGLGSCLSDLLSGYMIYVPITFIVKAVIAIVCYFVYHKLLAKVSSVIVKGIITGCFSTFLVAAGYCFFEYFIYGAGAFASIPANLIQGVSGLVISTLLLPLFKQIPDFKGII